MYWPSWLFLSYTSLWKSWFLLAPLIQSPRHPPSPHRHTPICGQGIIFCRWRGRCGSSAGGYWSQPSTMTSWSPPWGSWPTLSNWWWWVHLSLICTYHSKLNPQFPLKQIYPSNIHQTQPPRIMRSTPETGTLHTRVHKHIVKWWNSPLQPSLFPLADTWTYYCPSYVTHTSTHMCYCRIEIRIWGYGGAASGPPESSALAANQCSRTDAVIMGRKAQLQKEGELEKEKTRRHWTSWTCSSLPEWVWAGGAWAYGQKHTGRADLPP